MVVPVPVVSVVLPVMPVALRALSVAFGDVRTTVPVSLRGTAWRLASAAVCGVTPTPVTGWLVPMPGVGVPAVPLACANAAALHAIKAVASKILVVVKVFMMKVSPVGLEQIANCPDKRCFWRLKSTRWRGENFEACCTGWMCEQTLA